MLSLNAATVTWSFGPERRQEFLHRVLQLRHRQRHALADVDRDDDLERRSFGGEVADGLRHAVLEQPELRLAAGRPTNRPRSVTTAVTCTTSTDTFSTWSRPLVRELATMRPPPIRLPTTRNVCGRTSAPASHSHSAAIGSSTLQTCLPSAKNRICADARGQHLREDFRFELRDAADVGVRLPARSTRIASSAGGCCGSCAESATVSARRTPMSSHKVNQS